MKAAVVIFPGSNSDHDALRTVGVTMGQEAIPVWHQESTLPDVDLVILPGGFSYGDYLRSGAIARFSPIMSAVCEWSRAGGLTMGICNGFQILCEAHLLPGALQRNDQLRFLSQDVYLRIERDDTPFTCSQEVGDVLRVPIAHGDGRFYASAEDLARIEETGRVLYRYCDAEGNVNPEDAKWNPNGSLNAIAGILDEAGTTLGMMPHPERSAEPILGNDDGRAPFESLLQHLSVKEAS